MIKRLPTKVDPEKLRRRLYQIAMDEDCLPRDAVAAARVLLREVPDHEPEDNQEALTDLFNAIKKV